MAGKGVMLSKKANLKGFYLYNILEMKKKKS